ncbi:MAG: radical SAM protein [Planctomycetota bacterium]
MCTLRCGVDRAAGERGPCRLAGTSRVYKTYVSLNEEPELVPALRVFLGGCNFRCPWCDEAPAAFRDAGQPIEAGTWAHELAAALAGGVRTISILGGEPSLHVHTLLAVARAAPWPLSISLNSNMYMTPEVLELLAGVIGHYLADFKFGNDTCARQLAGVPDYLATVTSNLRLAAAQAHVVVRHVLMPGHFECCFRPVVDWLETHLPGARFQLYPGYVPCGPAARDSRLGRLNQRAEIAAAWACLEPRGLKLDSPAPAEVRIGVTPLARGHGELGLTIGADGKLYCHDLTPELAATLAGLCPRDGERKRE